MTSEQEKLDKIKSEFDARMKAAERELKTLREAERKSKEATAKAQATAREAQEAEQRMKVEVP